MNNFDYNNIIEFDGVLEEILYQDRNTKNGNYLIKCITDTMEDFCTNSRLITCTGILSPSASPVHITGIVDDTASQPCISIISSYTI